MEKPIYPSPYMRITQGYMMGSHASSYAIDEAGMDTGIDHIKAPFTGVIKKIYTVSNEVWLESVDKVLYPDGTIDYMTILFCHDNDVSNLFIGKTIKQGEIFYQEGTKGNASGNHCHIECAQGKFTGTGWYKNPSGYWSINNGKKPEDCLWIDDSITVLNNYGYAFKKIENPTPIEPTPTPPIPVVPDPPTLPDEDKTPEQDNGHPQESDDSQQDNQEKPTNPRLIFTCKSDDMYAIKLKNGQKLYLE